MSAAATLVLLLAVFGASARRIDTRLAAYVAQSLALAAFLILAADRGNHPHLYLGAAIALGLKCLVLPAKLLGIVPKPSPGRGDWLESACWLLAAGGVATLGSWLGREIAATASVPLPDLVAAGFGAAAAALIGAARDRDPAAQFVGLLSLENAVGLAGTALTQGRVVPFVLLLALEASLAVLFLLALDTAASEGTGADATPVRGAP